MGQVTNANNEGPAGGKVVAPTFQEAITQLEELGSNRATGSRATRHQYPVPPPLLSYFLSPFPGLCPSLPLLIYTPLWPRPVSNTHVVLSHLCFFAPTTPCLEQNSPQPVTEASVSFTSKTSLLPCSVCLDRSRVPQKCHPHAVSDTQDECSIWLVLNSIVFTVYSFPFRA